MCAMCNEEKSSFAQYIKHLRLFHEHSPDFKVTCNTDGCRRSYRRVRCLVLHVASFHKNKSGHRQALPQVMNVSDLSELEDVEALAASECEVDSGDRNFESTIKACEKHAALCVLKLGEKHILPVCVQQDIVHEIQDTVSQMHETYKSMFMKFCEEQNIPAEVGSGQFFTRPTSVFDDVYASINSDYKFRNVISQPQRYRTVRFPNLWSP